MGYWITKEGLARLMPLDGSGLMKGEYLIPQGAIWVQLKIQRCEWIFWWENSQKANCRALFDCLWLEGLL